MTRFTGEQQLVAHNGDFPAPGIKRITEKVYFLTGIGSNATLVEGEDSCLLIDAMINEQDGRAALGEVRKVTKKPIETLIYTHTHPDHMSGAGILAANAKEIIARRPTVPTYGKSELINEVGTARGAKQWGFGLTPEESINIGAGAFMPSFGQAAILRPTRLVAGERSKLNIDGIAVELIAADGETDDQTFVWLPEERVLCSGDDYYHSFPNVSPVRGGQYRNAAAWVESLNTILRLAPDHLLPGHTEAVSGRQAIQDLITTYRDGVQYIVEETLKGMNQGLTPEQLVERVQLPAQLKDLPQLQEYYGKVSWTIRSIFSGYLGWFDGNPTRLGFMPVKARAEKQLALAGGAARVLTAAEKALADEDEQWAAELCDILLDAEKLVPQAKDLKAKALSVLARLDVNACARHYYLCCAKELEK
ncbi:MAG: alkyl/aryl-sulfatase [Chloroflexi bacterium]|nr:alkyl/aryl-sulfatase [Chloroflexota bacterium]MCL5109406.1 alkyl/aryl-sulfatase [Chloroflexota bacterium]